MYVCRCIRCGSYVGEGLVVSDDEATESASGVYASPSEVPAYVDIVAGGGESDMHELKNLRLAKHCIRVEMVNDFIYNQLKDISLEQVCVVLNLLFIWHVHISNYLLSFFLHRRSAGHVCI